LTENKRKKLAIIEDAFPHHVTGKCKPDMREINKLVSSARRLTAVEVRRLKLLALLPSVDWSRYLGFIRNQGGTPTCQMQAYVACLDILKECEKPNSPNLSAWFWAYGYWSCVTEEYAPDPNIPPKLDDEIDVAIVYGCCSEASFSSRTNLPVSIPTADQVAEAALSKLGEKQQPLTGLSLDQVKSYLNEGPLMTLWNGHCMALVGYDDAKSQVKFVNSWGDRDNGGFKYWNYSDIESRLSATEGPILIQPMKNTATPVEAFPYTGRIKLRHKISRSYVTVSLGVPGEQEVLIWGLPESSMKTDNSEYLVFRFPLPAYAASYWPPSRLHKWFVRVTDTSPNPSSEVMGCVEEIVFHERKSLSPSGYWFNMNQNIPRGGSILIEPMLGHRKPRSVPRKKKKRSRRPGIGR
jgi:hypothetical protein